jgi:hypothetical protein
MTRQHEQHQTSPLQSTSLLHGSTRAGHTAKRIHLWKEDSKNCDRNGPEGQFMTASTTLCNAGSPPYGAVFMISAQSIKVSMKKRRKRREQELGEGRRIYRQQLMVCARLQLSVHVCNLEIAWVARACGIRVGVDTAGTLLRNSLCPPILKPATVSSHTSSNKQSMMMFSCIEPQQRGHSHSSYTSLHIM